MIKEIFDNAKMLGILTGIRDRGQLNRINRQSYDELSTGLGLLK